MKKLIYTLVFITGLLLVYLFIPSKKYTYFRPSPDFYVYDQNNYLLTSTKYSMYANSKNLFEVTKNVENIGGTQVVVIAISNKETFDTTTIFNEWGIGKNDMGVLISLYYDDQEVPSLTNYGYDAGTNMMGYFPAFKFEEIANEYLNPYYNEINVMEFYYEVLNYIYTKIYNYESFNYDINNYIEVMYDSYYNYLPSSNKSSLGIYFDENPVKFVLFLVFFGTTSLTGLFYISFNKGSGGSSLGYKYKK